MGDPAVRLRPVVRPLLPPPPVTGAMGGPHGANWANRELPPHWEDPALTRATAILAGLFFLTSIGLAWMANSDHGPRSIFETAPASRTAPAGPGTPQVPTQGGILPMLQGGAASQPHNPVTQAPTAPQVPVHTAPATKPSAPSSPAPASGAPQVPTSH